MRWLPARPDRILIDKRSGYLNVARSGLDEVERLIQRGEIDVVVVLNWERLARRGGRRYAALYLARKYGREYRFGELVPGGRLPDTPEGKVQAGFADGFGQRGRGKTIRRTKRGRV